MSENKFNSTKISEPSLKNLRLIAALTGEKQYEVLDRLLEQEKQRLQGK
jgi:hypothetical protein